MEYILGIITGILLALVAVFVGKKYSHEINQEYVSSEPAQIITRVDLVDEITNGK